jgi:hypothetical protein
MCLAPYVPESFVYHDNSIFSFIAAHTTKGRAYSSHHVVASQTSNLLCEKHHSHEKAVAHNTTIGPVQPTAVQSPSYCSQT